MLAGHPTDIKQGVIALLRSCSGLRRMDLSKTSTSYPFLWFVAYRALVVYELANRYYGGRARGDGIAPSAT